MKLDIRAFAFTAGILWGLCIFVCTLWLLAWGYDGHLIVTLNHFYFGYTYSVTGAFVGLAWGFLDGAFCATLFAWLYNKLAKSESAS